MITKILRFTICIISILSFFFISSCESIDDVNESIDTAIDEILGISAITE